MDRAVVWQALVVLTAAAIAVASTVHAARKPIDAGKLEVSVSQLSSLATEGQTLLEQRRASQVTRIFFSQHAAQLRHNAESLREALREEIPQPGIEQQLAAAVESAASLAALLGALDDPQREARNVVEIERLRMNLHAIDRALEVKTR